MAENNGGVPGSKLTAMMNAHIDSPLQKSYDPAVEQAYTEHASKFHDALVNNGGVTMAPEPGNEPLPVGEHEWYGVGGAPNPKTGEREPETVIPLHSSLSTAQFGTGHALGHILKLEGHNIENAAGRTSSGKPGRAALAGGWTEHGNAVLDASTVFAQKPRQRASKARNDAVKAAIDRKERAVFDAKNMSDIHTGI
jgi:hypothetical protein